MIFEPFTFFIIALTGIVTGIIGPFTASGSLIVIPALLFLGFDIKEALAMNMFASFVSWLIISRHMVRAKHVQWKFVPAFFIIAITGTFIGTHIAIDTPSEFLTGIVGFLIIFSVFLFLLSQKLGVEEKEASMSRHIAGLLLYSLATIYAGFFAGGSGIIQRLINLTCFGFTIIQSAATGGLVWLSISGVSALVYAYSGYLNLGNSLYAILLAVVMAGTSHYGAKLMLIARPQTIKNIFVVFAILAGLWIILGK